MKKMKNILKAAIIIAIALALVVPGAAAIGNTKTKTFCKPTEVTNPQISRSTASGTLGAALFEDDFENYTDFALDFPPWTQYDGDGQTTWGFESYTFPNMGYIGAFIIFNPSQCTPPLDDPTHSGDKYAACFDAVSVDILNDDWLITPKLTTGGFDVYVAIHCVNHDSFYLCIDDFVVTEISGGINISFWGRTGSSLYEPDRFQVGVSTSDNDPSSFTIITPDPYVNASTSWTLYSYTYQFQPEFEITIAGGLGVTATVENVGAVDATNVEATTTLTGGLIILPLGGVKTETLGNIAIGGSADAKTFVVGIGKPTITVDVTCDEGATASASVSSKFVILFIVLI